MNETRLEEYLMATGQTVEKVRQWQSVIHAIAEKTGEPVKDVMSIILRPLASGKVMLIDCHKLQEIGVPLSERFMRLVPSGNATDKELFLELTQEYEQALDEETWEYSFQVQNTIDMWEHPTARAGDPDRWWETREEAEWEAMEYMPCRIVRRRVSPVEVISD